MLINLKVEIAKKGWNDTQLADASGIARPNISRIINGKASITLKNAIRIKETLGTDMELEELFKDVPV